MSETVNKYHDLSKDQKLQLINSSIDIKVNKKSLKTMLVALGTLHMIVNVAYVFSFWKVKDFLVKSLITYDIAAVASLVLIAMVYMGIILGIRSQAEHYVFQKVKLTDFSFRFWCVYFIIHLDIDGKNVYAETRAFFHTGWKEPSFEDYREKTVTIGYNAKTEQVVVIDQQNTL